MAKRILLVNKFYYSRGGAEIVVINLRDMLTSLGYEVGIFTMDYGGNLHEPGIFTAPEVSFKGSLDQKLRFARRTLGGTGLKASFVQAFNRFAPDVVHLHNVHSYLSPAMAQWARERGARVVWTLHDYKLLCPAYSCLNHGHPCEKCYTAKWHVLAERCFKQSAAASALAWVEAHRWNRGWIERNVDAFVCPSQFMRGQMLKGGFSEGKLHVVCNFIDPVKAAELEKNSQVEKEDYYSYIGRLSEEKGVATLLKAAATLPYRLKVAGDGPLMAQFRQQYGGNANIEFLGQLSAVQVSNLQRKARFVVQPSECYENNPLSVIESLCAGTPVIGARIGGIPELITPSCGLTYAMGNATELAGCITEMMEHGRRYDNQTIAAEASERFSAKAHFAKLKPLYFPE